jgi:APA family basic amino acid/polyamine antiporter
MRTLPLPICSLPFGVFHAKLRGKNCARGIESISRRRKILLRGIFKTKNLDDILAAAQEEGHKLKRTLGPINITLLGIGAIIGAGIFATVGTAAAGDASRPGAGPSLMVSFGITAIVCAFTALCYAEMAAMVPISGSAYTYSYATLGELVAWIIGWALMLEYAIGNVAVAISWAGYFNELLASFHIALPDWLVNNYRTATPEVLAAAPHLFGHAIIFNAPAFGIVALITIILVWGIKESAQFNAGMVVVKIIVLLFFISLMLYYVSPSKMTTNWHPFQPIGWGGTFAAAAVVFFAYIGFDAVSTVAEETKNPARDLPVGIIASLIICTILYIAVAAVFTGAVPFDVLGTWSKADLDRSLSKALTHVAPQARWQGGIIAFGSVVAHTAVLLVFQLGQPRIFFSMARDGLLPPVFARVHPRFKTPHITTILTGVIVAGFAAFMSIDEMVDLTNIGTLFAFVLVCVGIIILRYKEPNRHRPFKVPLGAWPLPTLGAVSCMFLMYYLPPTSWWRFVAWLLLGLAVYLSYSYSKSEIGKKIGRAPITAPWLMLMALGSFLLAIGLLTIPHDANVVDSFHKAASGFAEGKREIIAFGCIGVGSLAMIIGALIGLVQRKPA